jgi:carbonic anhydrase
MGRRGVLAAAGLLAGAALSTRRAEAASGDYDAMLVNCIDPRFTSNSLQHMAAGGMRDRYSQFVIAGGPIGAIHPRFAPWHDAFWDNLDITVQLHNIKRVVAMTHRDCGAAKLAFGEAAVATRPAETAAHAEALRAFAAEVRRRKPALAVLAGIMDLDGRVDPVA